MKKVVKKDEQNPYLEKLEELGFSKAEADIYVYLLRRGKETGVSKIAVGTLMHRQQVYVTLPALLTSGVIEEVEDGKISKYKARPPQVLEKVIRKKMVMAEDLAVGLQKISKVGHEQDFEIVIGDKGIRAYQMEFVQNAAEGETQYIIGGSSQDFLEMMGGEYERMLALQEKKKFNTFLLSKKEEKDIYSKYRESKVNFNAVFIDGLPDKLPQFTVRKNEVLLYSYFNPPMLYVIKSEEVAEKFKEFFFLLWSKFGGEALKVI